MKRRTSGEWHNKMQVPIHNAVMDFYFLARDSLQTVRDKLVDASLIAGENEFGAGYGTTPLSAQLYALLSYFDKPSFLETVPPLYTDMSQIAPALETTTRTYYDLLQFVDPALAERVDAVLTESLLDIGREAPPDAFAFFLSELESVPHPTELRVLAERAEMYRISALRALREVDLRRTHGAYAGATAVDGALMVWYTAMDSLVRDLKYEAGRAKVHLPTLAYFETFLTNIDTLRWLVALKLAKLSTQIVAARRTNRRWLSKAFAQTSRSVLEVLAFLDTGAYHAAQVNIARLVHEVRLRLADLMSDGLLDPSSELAVASAYRLLSRARVQPVTVEDIGAARKRK